MKFLVALLRFTIVGYVLLPSKATRYDGHELWRIVPQTVDQLTRLVHLVDEADDLQVDFWQEPVAVLRPTTIRVPPTKLTSLNLTLAESGLEAQVIMDNIQTTIDDQKRQLRSIKRRATGFDYSKYHTLAEINSWIRMMAANHPDIVSLFTISTSFEGRPITALKITGKKSSATKPGFFYSGGLHGREWISPATVLYITSQLIEKYGKDNVITRLVDSFDWYVLPVFNVDGYEYTWTEDRLWRKTRSKSPTNSCSGTDPNRNFNWRWCSIGTSRNPCSERFCGQGAFSEREVKDVADFLQAVPGRFTAFVDFHGFAQAWLIPWGHSKRYPKDFVIQNVCAKEAVSAIQAVHGTKYIHGTISQVLYRISGGSSDWAYGVGNIPHSVTVELRDKGDFGFLLPPEQIIPSGEETLQGLLAMAQCILR